MDFRQIATTALLLVASNSLPANCLAQIDAVAGSSNARFRSCVTTSRGLGWLTEAPSTCAREELERQDAKLNADYKVGLAKLGSRAVILRESQRQWLKTRDAKCKAAEGSQIDGPDFRICMMEETTARVADLNAFINRP